jgi:hypothetical protein
MELSKIPDVSNGVHLANPSGPKGQAICPARAAHTEGCPVPYTEDVFLLTLSKTVHGPLSHAGSCPVRFRRGA